MTKQYVARSLNDETISKLAMGALRLYPFVDPDGMHIRVCDAVITLTGSDLDPDQVQRAISLLSDFTCVRRVVNHTTLAAG